MARLLQWLLWCMLCLAAAAPETADASAVPLRGAATHPLWSDSSVADFDAELDRLADAGANVVRIDVSWSTLEEHGRVNARLGTSIRRTPSSPTLDNVA